MGPVDGEYTFTPTDLSSVAPVTLSYTIEDDDGAESSAVATVSVTPYVAPNQPPTDITLDVTSVSENAEGVHIANLFGTDPNAGDQLSYSIIGGENADMFEIMGGVENPMLHLASGVSADFEGENPLEVTVRATDASGAHYDETFTINVTDVNEAPVADDGVTFTMAEDGTLLIEEAPFLVHRVIWTMKFFILRT